MYGISTKVVGFHDNSVPLYPHCPSSEFLFGIVCMVYTRQRATVNCNFICQDLSIFIAIVSRTYVFVKYWILGKYRWFKRQILIGYYAPFKRSSLCSKDSSPAQRSPVTSVVPFYDMRKVCEIVNFHFRSINFDNILEYFVNCVVEGLPRNRIYTYVGAWKPINPHSGASSKASFSLKVAFSFAVALRK